MTIPLKRALSTLKPIGRYGSIVTVPVADGVSISACDGATRIVVTVPGSCDSERVLTWSQVEAMTAGGILDPHDGGAGTIFGGGVSVGAPADPATVRPRPTLGTVVRSVHGSDAAAVGAALVAVLPMISTDATRIGLGGACWGDRAVVATDGHRLGAVAVPATDAGKGSLVPRAVIVALGRLPAPTRIDAYLPLDSDGRGAVVLEGPGYRIETLAAPGDFPDWRQVVPSSPAHSARFSGLAPVVAAALRATRGTAAHPIKVTINGASSWSSVMPGEVQWAVEHAVEHAVEIGPQDREARLGLNARYLADALDFVGGGDAVEMQLHDRWTPGGRVSEDPGFDAQLEPVLIAGTMPGRLAIVMPMRLD